MWQRQAVLFVATCCIGHATTIFSHTGTLDGHQTLGGTGQNQILFSSWTQAGSYNLVSISAELQASNTTVTAYLTTRVGTGTTMADEIAQTTLLLNGDSFVELFTGLSLGPATYYLTITTSAPASAGWGYTFVGTTVTAPGVTANGNGRAASTSCMGCFVDLIYPPASTFASQTNILQIIVETAVPEPQTLPLASLALLSIGLAAHYRRPTRH